MLESIHETTGMSKSHDRLSLHLILNLMLPIHAQIKTIPEVGYKDMYFALTERQLVLCLLKPFKLNKSDPQKRARKRTRLVSSENDKESLARILKDVFGSKPLAEINTQDEIGRLSFFLFLNGANTSYKRGASMLWAKSEKAEDNSGGLLHQQDLGSRVIFNANQLDELQKVRSTLEGMEAKDPSYAETKARFKSLVLQEISSPQVFQRKYALSGDLSTNGYDLRVMAYKLMEKKGSPKSATSTTPQPTMSVSSLTNPTTSKKSAPATASTTSTTPISPTAPTTQSAAFPWSVAPVIKGWPYVTDKFDSQSKIDDLYTNYHTRQTRCIGIDPGVACTATATLSHSSFKSLNINLSTPRGPRNDIDRRYRHRQSHLKQEAGIPDVEAGLVPLKSVEVQHVDTEIPSAQLNHGQSEQQTLTLAMDKAAEEHLSSVIEYATSQARASTILREYYGSVRFKKDTFDYKEAARHDLDRATTAILDLRSTVPDGLPNTFLASPLVIAIGDGDYRDWRGQGRGTAKFVNNLIRRASISCIRVTNFSEIDTVEHPI